PFQHLAPVAFASIRGALVPASADTRLNHDISPRQTIEQRMVRPPPAPHARGEKREGAVGRRADLNRFAHRRRYDGPPHDCFSARISASSSALNEASELSQN